MNTPQTIQVMLVDDHNVVRSGLATFLRAYEDLELVGEAKNGLEALQLCHQKKPDVILMDLMMPVMRDDGGDAPGGGCAATVVTQLRERHCTQDFPTPFAQAPFRIHSAARVSSSRFIASR